MPIDFYGTERHFQHHLEPVFGGLENKGDWTGSNPTRPVVVASYGDLKRVRRLGYTKIARMEHGAGQGYDIDHGSYAGGRDHDDVSLFLMPNQYSADRWQARYPKARVEVVGCPKLDTLPVRQHSIGIQSEVWQASVADIRTHLRTLVSDQDGNPLCVAHAIANASPNAPEHASLRGTPLRPSTTDVGISPEGQRRALDRPDLVPLSTAQVKSAMSECTSSSRVSCRGRVTSAEPPTDLRQLFAGIRLRSDGVSARPGSPTLRIPTTTYGCVSFATSSTTAKAAYAALGQQPKVVCLSWHWDCYIVPETVSAFGHYRAVLPEVADTYNVVGHGHPRGMVGPPRLIKKYQRLGIPLVSDFQDVCRQADVYVCDNSSSLFEYAATGRPVVVLNQPSYRRNTEHGLRFWSAAKVGIQVNEPAELVAAIAEALADPPARQADREAALAQVYAYRSGAAQRAARALEAWA